MGAKFDYMVKHAGEMVDRAKSLTSIFLTDSAISFDVFGPCFRSKSRGFPHSSMHVS